MTRNKKQFVGATFFGGLFGKTLYHFVKNIGIVCRHGGFKAGQPLFIVAGIVIGWASLAILKTFYEEEDIREGDEMTEEQKERLLRILKNT